MRDESHSPNSLRILSQSDCGYIGQCNCCDHFNFAFGNILFIFSEDGLRGFQSVLYEEFHFHKLEEPLPNGKNYMLPSPIPNFMISFNNEEIEQVKRLFQEALIVLEVDKIFSYKK
ncbi:DUF6686 family protein [Dyadobacter aurulentus]|uniref:DUF6686 family protein n=1 Tax=Dyadobacter sp. UC 10 TaxID=2605428 RepID=UPI0011F15B8F|nr:DUF6686 family protein [Dyadobacter sp. UC 10]KAA0990739.1 hypothetical protein FXO21_11555 [Dyadobacter sp. UC 10]